MRWRLIVIGIAGFVAYMGWQEYTLAQLADPTPAEIRLAEVEQGTTPENAHVELGQHWRIYPSMVYTYEIPRGEDENSVKPDYKVEYAYYPIISSDHEFFATLDKKRAEYGSVEAIPDKEFPQVKEFEVLVKTRAFDTIGDMPDGWQDSESIQGTIINEIESVGSEDARLINQSYPKVNVDEVLVLEKGREPMSEIKGLGMMGGSVLVIALVIGFLIRAKVKEKEEAV